MIKFGLVLGALLAMCPPTSAARCADCNGDAEVTVDEVVTMVNLALTGGTTGCANGDSNGDGAITVDEIVAVVNSALGDCF